MTVSHTRTCHLCEAMCGIIIETEGDQVKRISGDPKDPLSRGHICPKAAAIADIQNDPDRLRKPMRRDGDQWHEISWDEAFDTVVQRIHDVKQKHGSNAVGIYAGNPNVHNYGNMTHSNLFLKQLKTRNRYSATSVDQMPHQLVGYWMFGHQSLIPIPDVDHCDFFLMLGANPLASNGSLWTVPDVRKRLKALQDRGGEVVVIDPRRTETAALAKEHHFITPGADAALLAAMVNVLFVEDLADPAHLKDLITDLDVVAEAVKDYTPERVAPFCGIAADTIRDLTRRLAKSKRAVVYGRMGVSTQSFGTTCQWLIQVLNIATGNFDRVGGVLFTKPALDTLVGPAGRPGHFDVWQSRVRKLPEFSGELPAATLAEEITTPGEGQIRAMVTSAGNPVLSVPNGPQLAEAFESLEFMVSVDCYLNETTRYADIILPPTGPLERDHYDIVFHVFAVRNTAKYSPPVLPKSEGGYVDWEIFSELGRRFADLQGTAFTPLPPPHVLLDMGLRAGPYDINLEELKKHPHGIDFGPLEPSLPDRLFTPDKRIKCAPRPLLDDLKRLEAALEAGASADLLLIGRRHLRSNNSWMHNSERLVKGPQRNHLMMHPDDMNARGIKDGDTVEVRSRVGTVQIQVRAGADIMAGVISIPHGWGHGKKGAKLNVAAKNPGVSVNDLTDHMALDDLSGNAAVNGVPVEVHPL